MICNERQYKITSKQLEELKSALISLNGGEASDWLVNAQKAALESQISDLESQVAEYSFLKQGDLRHSEHSDLSSLPRVLIQARIAKGLSQKSLADLVKVKPQQIQRYESSEYMGASLSRLIEISRILDVKVSESWGGSTNSSGSTVFVWEKEEDVDWAEFPVKEMIKRGWIELKHKASPAEAVKNFFLRAAGGQYATALHRKKFYGGNSPKEYSLLAWQARVLEKARDVASSGDVGDFFLNDSWVRDLALLSVSDNALENVKDFLASKGVILIIEPHLQGTYLDGAAMMLDTGHPVIAITLRHDRLDNFWFVIFHELGHVFLHLYDSLNMDFFDEEDGSYHDPLEEEADKFALDSLIPQDAWDTCLSRFSMSRQSVLKDAERLKIHPSIIAGRIRKEKNNYTILTDLLGHGEVRTILGGD
ncbi:MULTISPECIES: XRE family transcriptional regulator [unclassified Halomonas]|uniref:XRE family transcriptional regulator n=1 Tax=unclassified Halomonas TaxID=2609666 RepID=UPI001EF42729|nr:MULTISPECIES: XRE family transcriptional regulator [unclassified Halomonas]MCG7590008.1 XRE family transcriptional regulator [Halomonas sp. McD50-5]MCG7615942.1 XRE family transcriptional regulator [Halomonas sp. McD50-4]